MPLDLEPSALQIEVDDAALRAYLQFYCFCSGPDEAMNQRGRIAAAQIRFRPAAPLVIPTRLTPAQAQLSTEEEARVQALFEQIAMPANMRHRSLDDFAWEANLIPRSSTNVLVIGCGDGIELLFLRAVLPHARLTAVDYRQVLNPGILQATAVTFIEGDMEHHLRNLQPEYDLIFSNHTLEHFYTPDATLQLIAGLLIKGGCMLSTFPMMGRPGSPYLERLHAIAQSGGNIHGLHPVDVVFVDLGHPWKSNPSDAAATFARAGFHNIRIFQREGYLCRSAPRTASGLRSARRLRKLLYLTLLAPVHLMAKLAVALGLRQAPRLLFGIERRLWFGPNRTMNELSEEICILGER